MGSEKPEELPAGEPTKLDASLVGKHIYALEVRDAKALKAQRAPKSLSTAPTKRQGASPARGGRGGVVVVAAAPPPV